MSGTTGHMPDYEVRAGLTKLEGFDVIGLSVITDKEKAAEDINALWEKFFETSIGFQIPQKTNDMIYAVYSDYEGGHEDPYRVTIGYKVKSTASVAGDLHHVHIPTQEYAVLAAAGEQPKALIETWEAVWSGDLDRTYTADFELYGPRFFKEGLHEILVHVGVK